MTLKNKIEAITLKAKKASYQIAGLSTEKKNKALLKMARILNKNFSFLVKENEKDIKAGKRDKLSASIIDRLKLSPKRIKEMSMCLREVAALTDPVGKSIKTWKMPNGLKIGKIRTPFGVIAIIYESRPNVTSDSIGLCLKSGNSIILRGGSEAFYSNRAITSILIEATKDILPENVIQIIPTQDRKALDYLLKSDKYVDILIPRGGESLINYVAKNAKMPVIKHYKGVCHVFVDRYAKFDMAVEIVCNAKTQRPGVCNAIETLLVDEKIAKSFLPLMLEKLKAAGVEIRGCKKTKKVTSWIKVAKESDWYEEYLDLILAVKIVASIDEAIEHIRKYGSNHSDAIVTENNENASNFLLRVDSACVYVNASTRFTDGYQFGMGAEMGISTDKLHARGPMALEELTTYKYTVLGNGQIRE
ncbi:MAG: glutamate-5-semialdehyde dehydrogenase [Candidatus Saelkia tenebricola]|nr:glutamate-5-semialdehyde dehydrogenase [Candidatus Saelkia tenebricola]